MALHIPNLGTSWLTYHPLPMGKKTGKHQIGDLVSAVAGLDTFKKR
jgi:hypothetical protein